MNVYTQLFLRKLCNSHQIPQLSGKLVMVIKLFHLNELEIAVWSLLLDHFNWQLESLSLETFLFATAAQAKSYLNTEIEMNVYFKKLEHDFPKMQKAYKSWKKAKAHKVSLTATDINRQYKKFKQVLLLIR
eukprot:TRINITY_DN1136_c0_g2_i1.p1 TRINITY_DN1136_c0_g2~~TRINITY_DN1136_c0_g2_i1.p1  ORF type:complete len:131 (-),score=20.58 TRINITY_DN1136_c0_g2_i1:609-1001(-)